MRLAEYLGISTTNFRGKYLHNQFLRHKDNSDACIFLGKTGCTVHKDRPMVCRLYPLARTRLENGEEIFFEVRPHPESEGEYGQASIVDLYLLSQDVGPFIGAENAYLELIQKMATASLNVEDLATTDKAISQPEINNSQWILDPDPVIEGYCKLKGMQFPSTAEEKLEMHLSALYAWVNGEWDPSPAKLG
jgi:uncharacterized protein